jgi:hypothetical protein
VWPRVIRREYRTAYMKCAVVYRSARTGYCFVLALIKVAACFISGATRLSPDDCLQKWNTKKHVIWPTLGDSRYIHALNNKSPFLLDSAFFCANMLAIFLPNGISPSNNTSSKVKCLIFLSDINPFRSYVEPPPTVRFSCLAPMSEDVRHGFVAFVRPLSEPVRRFFSCSTDIIQQIAQAVLFLYLHVFLF